MPDGYDTIIEASRDVTEYFRSPASRVSAGYDTIHAVPRVPAGSCVDCLLHMAVPSPTASLHSSTSDCHMQLAQPAAAMARPWLPAQHLL